MSDNSFEMNRVGVRMQDITKRFGAHTVLNGIDLSVSDGGFVALVGESGGGKSTLLRILAALETADEGTIEVSPPVSVAFQDARLLPWRHVWENVVFGQKGSHSALRNRALAALAEVGLAARADAWPGTLSGGEAQRAALARALIGEPAVLLLDEPFGALDALTRLRMQGLLLRLWERHAFTVVLVTHDVDEALTLADRVAVIAGGRIAESVDVPLTRPRDRSDQRFNAMRDRLLDHLAVRPAAAA